jgi:hypothetical protein
MPEFDPEKMSREAYDSLFNENTGYLSQLKKLSDNGDIYIFTKNLTVHANNLVDENGNELPPVAGEIDMISVDKNGNKYIVDLKTTTNGRKLQWQKKLFEYRYDVQAAWYLRGYTKIKGVEPKGFVHLVVETLPPYHAYVYVADATVIECGETGGSHSQGYKQAIEILKECEKTNLYPMPQMEIEPESMPDWTL